MQSVGPSSAVITKQEQSFKQSFWDYGLTLMTDAISFLITERSRVNLHIYKKNLKT